MQKEGLIDVTFVPTKKNVADVATKNVTAEVMESHNDLITADRDYWKTSMPSSMRSSRLRPDKRIASCPR